MCLLLGKRRRARQKTPCAFCSSVVSAWCRLLRKSDVWLVDPLTRWPFQKRTPQGQFRGPPTCTHQVWRRSVKGPRRSRGTNKQTNKQTNAARIIVWYLRYFREKKVQLNLSSRLNEGGLSKNLRLEVLLNNAKALKMRNSINLNH